MTSVLFSLHICRFCGGYSHGCRLCCYNYAFAVLAARHIWLLGPAPAGHPRSGNEVLFDHETELESYQQISGRLPFAWCLSFNLCQINSSGNSSEEHASARERGLPRGYASRGQGTAGDFRECSRVILTSPSLSSRKSDCSWFNKYLFCFVLFCFVLFCFCFCFFHFVFQFHTFFWEGIDGSRCVYIRNFVLFIFLCAVT